MSPIVATAEIDRPAADRLSIAIDFQGHGIGRIVVPLFVVREARREMPDNLAELGQRILASADG